jgi:hypothetical protein
VAANLLALLEHRRDWTPARAHTLFYGLDQALQREFCVFLDGSQDQRRYLRLGRQAAVERGLVPDSVQRLIDTIHRDGAPLGPGGDLVERAPTADAATLIFDAAATLLDPAGLAAARTLLPTVDSGAGELGITSSGWIELTLGLSDAAAAAAAAVRRRLAALPGEGPLVTNDPALVLAARELWRVERSVVHLAEYLADWRPVAAPRGVAVFHDPGLLARDLDLTTEPRKLLRAAGYDLVEAARHGRHAAEDGPLAGYPDPALAASIARARVAELVSSGADVIVTGSPWSVRNLAPFSPLPVMDLATALQGAP